jgi:hypothetical protein
MHILGKMLVNEKRNCPQKTYKVVKGGPRYDFFIRESYFSKMYELNIEKRPQKKWIKMKTTKKKRSPQKNKMKTTSKKWEEKNDLKKNEDDLKKNENMKTT